MSTSDPSDLIRLMRQLGLDVPPGEETSVAEAVTRLFEQASLVLSSPLPPPPDGAAAREFEP